MHRSVVVNASPALAASNAGRFPSDASPVPTAAVVEAGRDVAADQRSHTHQSIHLADASARSSTSNPSASYTAGSRSSTRSHSSHDADDGDNDDDDEEFSKDSSRRARSGWCCPSAGRATSGLSWLSWLQLQWHRRLRPRERSPSCAGCWQTGTSSPSSHNRTHRRTECNMVALPLCLLLLFALVSFFLYRAWQADALLDASVLLRLQALRMYGVTLTGPSADNGGASAVLGTLVAKGWWLQVKDSLWRHTVTECASSWATPSAISSPLDNSRGGAGVLQDPAEQVLALRCDEMRLHLARLAFAQAVLIQSSHLDDVAIEALQATSLSAAAAMQSDQPLPAAGVPRFHSVFARDLFVSGILTQDPSLLRAALILAAQLQGQKRDAMTGEEHGKVFHEYPSSSLRGKQTLYAASDSTAWYLIAWQHYWNITHTATSSPAAATECEQMLQLHVSHISQALMYTQRHLDELLRFQEDPQFAGEDNTFYALKVTYWKDSSLPDRSGGAPEYPLKLSYLQAAYVCALRAAASLPLPALVCAPFRSQVRAHTLARPPSSEGPVDAAAASNGCRALANHMRDTLISQFLLTVSAPQDAPSDASRAPNDDDDHVKYFAVGYDKGGLLTGVSSDTLHLLWFLEPSDLSSTQLDAIARGTEPLVSELGYVSRLHAARRRSSDTTSRGQFSEVRVLCWIERVKHSTDV